MPRKGPAPAGEVWPAGTQVSAVRKTAARPAAGTFGPPAGAQRPWAGSLGLGSLRGMRPDFAQRPATGSDRQHRPVETSAGPAAQWRGLKLASRACCCPAKPVVVAVMPPAPGRDHPTDLLLCGHHYRASCLALLAAGATVYDAAGRMVVPPPRVLLGAS